MLPPFDAAELNGVGVGGDSLGKCLVLGAIKKADSFDGFDSRIGGGSGGH